MKKVLTFFLTSYILLFADSGNMNPTVLDIHSFTLPKNNIEIKTSFYKINDTLDIFNIRENQLSSSVSSFGTIGNMRGYETKVGYGVTDKINFYYKYEYMNINYGEKSSIKNKKNEFNLKFKLYSNSYKFINALSLGIGYIKNSSKPLEIKNDLMLNYMIKKIIPQIPISIKKGVIHYQDTSITLYDKEGNKIYPFLRIENLKDESYYLRIMFGKKFSKGKMDIYGGVKKTKVYTDISIEPSNHKLIKDAIKKFNISIPNLYRDETTYFLGINEAFEYKSFLFEVGYEYNYIDREKELNFQRNNHIIDMAISKIISPYMLIYIGGKILLKQFNSIVPYLYNKYTQTQFDKKYGYAKIGIVWSF